MDPTGERNLRLAVPPITGLEINPGPLMGGSGSMPWRIVSTFPLADIAKAARYLRLDESEWTTGTCVQINRGRGL